MIGQAAARAVAQRVQVAEHTLRRHRVLPHTRDDLAFPATLPSSDDEDPQASVNRVTLLTVFSIHCDPYCCFPQRGYRIKPTNNHHYCLFRPSPNSAINVSLSKKFPLFLLSPRLSLPPAFPHQPNQRASWAKPATELRRRITAQKITAQKGILGGSVVGCPLNGREKARPMEGHYRVPSLFSTRSNQALRPGRPPKPLSN